MRFRVFSLIAAAIVFASTAACDESLSSLTGPTPNLEPTLSSIQKEIFDTADSSGRRACTNCHTSVGRVPSAGLDLSGGNAYARLVGVASVERPGLLRVAAGNPDNSYLIHKLEGRTGIGGVPMPFGGPYLSPGQILVIRRWIELGAQNN